MEKKWSIFPDDLEIKETYSGMTKLVLFTIEMANALHIPCDMSADRTLG
jgi:hypothetical protein